MTLVVLRKSQRPVRWCQTPMTATADEPPRLTTPRLPRGALLDELAARLTSQLAAAPSQKWPAAFSAWGGLAARREKSEAPGRFFRTHHDGTRRWLLDPDGHPFWSARLVSVRVDTTSSYDGLETVGPTGARRGASARGEHCDFVVACQLRPVRRRRLHGS